MAVKVDRDERPDIDSRYQVAVSAISGQGGWPLTAFLTPDGKPFYGGTYFPPDDNYGRPSFKRVLQSIADAYHQKNTEVVDQAQMVEIAISRAESFAGGSGEFSPKVIDAIVESALKMFDPQNGGFGSAPKFPHPAVLDLLMDQYARSGDEKLRDVFVPTLEKMARGGVYDQLAGGFHRYSVDEHWIVPHFEKMCYDNSELLKNYVHAYQVTGSEFFAAVARDIVRWMDEWLSDRERGGFYASQDADYSMDDDGDYFTWTRAEMQAVLTEEEAAVAGLHYDVNEVGEMHHNPEKNVLYVRASLEEIAKRLSLTVERVPALLESARQKMYAARLKRPTPYVDKTVYVGWNSLCVSAYLEAAKVLKLDGARHFALRSLDRVLAEAWHAEQGLQHVVAYSDPAAERRQVPGLLDDYAFTAVACLDAYEATADLSYFNFAQRIADKMVDRFFDPVSGGFFDTADWRTGEGSGSAGHATETVSGFSHSRGKFRGSHRVAAAVRFDQPAELSREGGTDPGVAGRTGRQVRDLRRDLWHCRGASLTSAHPDRGHRRRRVGGAVGRHRSRVLRLSQDGAQAGSQQGRSAESAARAGGDASRICPCIKEGKSVAVVCSGFSCQPPITDPEQLQAKPRQRAEELSARPGREDKKRGLTMRFAIGQPGQVQSHLRS